MKYQNVSGELIGYKAIKAYILGGHAEITLISPSGKHRNYSFRYPSKKTAHDFKPGTMFVYTLVGHRQWSYVGMLGSDGWMHTTRASKFSRNSPEFKGANYVALMMKKDVTSGMKITHSGICSVCGRKLTNPKYASIGIGPRCLKNLQLKVDLDV